MYFFYLLSFCRFQFVLTILNKLRSLFRDYIDRLRNNRKERIRVIGEDFSDETKAPTLAPRWTRAGYEGRLKDAVTKVCSDQEENRGEDKNGEDNFFLGFEEEENGGEDREEENGGKDQEKETGGKDQEEENGGKGQEEENGREDREKESEGEEVRRMVETGLTMSENVNISDDEYLEMDD